MSPNENEGKSVDANGTLQIQKMKLWHSPGSPFVRMVLVTAHECALAQHIELLAAKTHPVIRDEAVYASNPLGKIPCLVLEDGHVLMDSRVICEYLDALNTGDKLIPAEGMARYNVLVTQSIALGMLDAAVSMRYEGFTRPEEKRWPDWISGQRDKITSALDYLEHWLPAKIDRIHMGTIAIGCALGYLDFRQSEFNWREGRPLLTQIAATLGERDSFKATAPQ